MASVTIIGVGNAYRGDDGAGLAVARHLRERGLPGVAVVETSGEGTAVMDAWRDAEAVILIDAVSSQAMPGTIHRFDVHAEILPTRFFHGSTHTFGVAEAIALAHTLGWLPPVLIVYGIEGACFEPGTTPSALVELAIERLAGEITAELEARDATEPSREPLVTFRSARAVCSCGPAHLLGVLKG